MADRPLKPRTRGECTRLLSRHLLLAFGDAALTGITPGIVRKWWSGLDQATSTVNARAYALVKAVLNPAVADDELAANPCRIGAASSAPRARELRPATIEELEIITAGMPANGRALVLICAWCALRLGEALVVGTPKSAAGTRVVAIPPYIVPELRKHLDEYVGKAGSSLLFSVRDGNSNLQPSSVPKAWRKARAAAGRDDLRIHDLRHTGATTAAMTSATLAELQERLRHSTVAAALRYQHAAQRRDAIRARARTVRGARTRRRARESQG